MHLSAAVLKKEVTRDGRCEDAVANKRAGAEQHQHEQACAQPRPPLQCSRYPVPAAPPATKQLHFFHTILIPGSYVPWV